MAKCYYCGFRHPGGSDCVKGQILREELVSRKEFMRRYHAFLYSKRWRRYREMVFAYRKYKCERCGGPAEHLHHRNYQNLGRETLKDVEVLCALCHARIHGK